jgi:2-desacetyl-2-hydroxyethyl bacteriochlorophyllide A dehydrogenase
LKTIILDEPGEFRAAETSLPDAPATGEALVRVRRVGVCGTDLHAYRGRQPFFTYPRILGHELGVEVVEVGPDVENVQPGDRCAVEPYLNCGRCIACRQGKTNCCVDLKVLGVHTDGGMREVIVVPASKLHRSDTLTLEQLTLVETLGIGAHAVNRSGLQPGENALVIGAGPIGLAVMQFALAAGTNVIAMDVNPTRLEFAHSHMGVGRSVMAGEGVLSEVSDLTDGDLPTTVFDATGNPDSMMRAFNFVAHGGRLVFVGLFQGDVTFHDPLFHRREMTILSSRNSTADDFRHIIALMERGGVDTTPWITHRASLETMISQFEGWLDPANRVLKAIVEL